MGKTISRKFWEDKHFNKDNYWLTGSAVSSIQGSHDINFNTYRNKRILEIGVGKGTLLKGLKKYTDNLVGCDISKCALYNIRDIAEIYLTEELQYIKPVDLAICHLVCQHCTDIEVNRIINDVKLKEGGVLSLQYAYLTEKEEDFDDIYIQTNYTHFFRSPEEMLNMINETDKQIIETPIIKTFPDFNWQILKIGNRYE